MDKIIRKINRFIYSFFYDVKFEKGYEYTGFSVNSEFLIDYMHNEYIKKGYEQCSDIIVFLGKIRVIYRKNIN